MCKDCRNERFHTEIAFDENTPGVKTSYTMEELNDTIHAIGNVAIQTKDEAALKTASVIAFLVSQNEEMMRKAAFDNARREVFAEAVREALDMDSLDKVKEHLKHCFNADSTVQVLGRI